MTSNDFRIRLYDFRDLTLKCKDKGCRTKGCRTNSGQMKASFRDEDKQNIFLDFMIL